MSKHKLMGLASTLLMLVLASAGCAGRPASRPPVFQPEFVLIDGRPVYAGTDNLLEALRTRLTSSRLGLTAVVPGDEPFLVVDGVRLLGTVSTLSRIRASDVKRVTMLRPVDAFTRFGPDAAKGAIIVETRAGTPATR